MKLKPIKTEQEYDDMMNWVGKQFNRKFQPDTPEGEGLQVALLLIKAYEDDHYALPAPDPIEAIRL